MPQDTQDPQAAIAHLVMVGPPASPDDVPTGPYASTLVVEPDPDKMAKWEERSGTVALGGVIAQAAGSAELVRYNLPGLHNIHAPTAALTGAFPGLKAVSRITVPTLPPADLAERLAGLEGPLELHIDAPGSEMILLEGLDAAGLLPRITALYLRCGEDVLFEGAAPRAALKTFVLDRGFILLGEDGSDLDWPVLHFGANQALHALEQARAELANCIAERDSAQAQNAELQGQLSAAETALTAEKEAYASARTQEESRLEELRGILDTRTREQEAEQAKAADLEKRLAEVEKAQIASKKDADVSRSALAAKEAELKSVTAQVLKLEQHVNRLTGALELEKKNHGTTRAAHSKLEAEATTRTEALSKADSEISGQKKRLQELTETHKKATDALAKSATDRDAAVWKMDKSKDDLSVALRLQLLAQADLRDLQTRYREVEQTRARQQALLEKLTPRLQQAAQQLQLVYEAETPVPELKAKTPAKSPRKPSGKATAKTATAKTKTKPAAKTAPKTSTKTAAKTRAKAATKTGAAQK